MGRKKKDPTNWTPPRQFRLSDDTMAELDWLCERLGGLSRSDVLRMAVRKLAQAEGREPRKSSPPPPE